LGNFAAITEHLFARKVKNHPRPFSLYLASHRTVCFPRRGDALLLAPTCLLSIWTVS
jgi:hypothetical protein